MGVTVAVHSSKGGTGKTCISVNLAALLALEGYNVCLLDMDLKAPCLCTFFNRYPKWWLNEYLDGKCDIDSILYDITSQFGTKGRFFIGLSNLDIAAVRQISNMDRKWQAKALKLLLEAKRSIFMNGVDVLILDTGPGVEFESVNAIAIADLVLSVIKPNKISYVCTEQLVKGVYMTLEKKCYLVENMCHMLSIDMSGKKEVFGLPVIASIPCICDIPMKNDTSIIGLTDPDHRFTVSIKRICRTIEEHIGKK
ncbi:MAG: P-loop NTPase [Methanomethylovorans sp.]|nr:P-loop NTPase [Methanomethylovorans sp.]